MSPSTVPITDPLLNDLAREAVAHPKTVLRVLVGLPVRAGVAARIREAIDRRDAHEPAERAP